MLLSLVLWMFVGLPFTGRAGAQNVTLLRETTYFTEPVCEDGSIDYLAVPCGASEGVTPENNASVLLWQVLGPQACQAYSREKISRRSACRVRPRKGTIS